MAINSKGFFATTADTLQGILVLAKELEGGCMGYCSKSPIFWTLGHATIFLIVPPATKLCCQEKKAAAKRKRKREFMVSCKGKKYHVVDFLG